MERREGLRSVFAGGGRDQRGCRYQFLPRTPKPLAMPLISATGAVNGLKLFNLESEEGDEMY